MVRVKIYGAGSIGNHMAHAARKKGWAVDICDVDQEALNRTQKDIYPSRYKKWDNEIGLYTNKNQPRGNYDLVIIGTPPRYHVSLALEVLKESPNAILIEKPLTTPDLDGLDDLNKKSKNSSSKIFVGYNHVVSKAIKNVNELLNNYDLGEIDTVDVEFREHWGGIFKAHHWLSGPADSYLSQWKLGGGACGEHSHAVNLWQHISRLLKKGRVTEVTCNMEYLKDTNFEYDKLCLINLKTEKGLLGRVVQDVITLPTKKWGNIQGKRGSLNFSFEKNAGVDEVNLMNEKQVIDKKSINKTRPDDFIEEMNHIEQYFCKNSNLDSPISLDKGIETMLVIAACHKSSKLGKTVNIDYGKLISNALG